MSEQKNFSLHEDWVVVALGALIIALSIGGLILPVPAFNWTNVEELTQAVFEPGNLGIVALQFIFVLVIAIIGALLTGKSVKNYLVGFPIVYIITILALILAGNSDVKALNL